MDRLSCLLVALLRKLLSGAFVSASIKRLLILYNFILRQLSIYRPRKAGDTPRPYIPPFHDSYVYNVPTTDVIYPSRLPPAHGTHIDLNPTDDHEHITTSVQLAPPVQSPTPTRGYLLPIAYQKSQSSSDVGSLAEDHDGDNRSVTSRLSVNNPGGSNISLPITKQPGLDTKSAPLRPSSRSSQLSIAGNSLRPASRNSQRPSSRNRQQPIKVSNTPYPIPPNTASPAGALPPEHSRPSSPQPARIVAPMSTASVKRWDRNVIM